MWRKLSHYPNPLEFSGRLLRQPGLSFWGVFPGLSEPRQEIDGTRGFTNGAIKALEAVILRDGLPCKLLLKRNGDFAMLAAEPLPGWCWLASDAALRRWAQEDAWWEPHVSLGYKVDEDPGMETGEWGTGHVSRF